MSDKKSKNNKKRREGNGGKSLHGFYCKVLRVVVTVVSLIESWWNSA